MSNTFKPVFLDAERCNGCVSCMRRCPTEAIRIRDGKATIMYDRCIGCGECVKVCRRQAKKEYSDSFDDIKNYAHTVAVVSPSIYGQFNHLDNPNYVLNGLKNLGFNDVYEVGQGAEIVSAATKKYMKNSNVVKPIIGSACSAVTNLILMRYEHLIPHLSPFKPPETIAAKIALNEVMAKTKLKREDIGVFVITQCAAKVVELKQAPSTKYIDRVISNKDIYFALLAEMNSLAGEKPLELQKAGRLGVSWATTFGEAKGLETDNYLCADGIENVIEVLNELEHGKLKDIDFLELYACPSGCVGGSMNIENAFVARTRLRSLRRKLSDKEVKIKTATEFMRAEPYTPKNIYQLSDDRMEAMRLTMKMKQIYEKLPQINCGACGAPNCKSLAEDIVKGVSASCKYKK